MEKKKLKVFICGSTFGQFYLEGLKAVPEFELVGILGSGSERTRNCAENYGIKQYQSIDEIPNDIDIACVVVRSSVLGGVGTELAREMLNRGIHVIQEHPSHPNDLQKCYKIASKNKLKYRTGSLYPYLNETSKFIACAKALNQQCLPVHVSVELASQISYPAVELLMISLPGSRGFEERSNLRENGPFQVLAGKIGTTPVTFQIHNEVNPDDPNNHMYMLHRITYIYPSGRLELSDTFGPVIWVPRMYASMSHANRGSLKGEYSKALSEHSATILGGYHPRSFEQVLTVEWPEAVYRNMLDFRGEILGDCNYSRRAQQELLCARQWNLITKAAGYPEIRREAPHQPVTAEFLNCKCNALGAERKHYGAD